MAKVEKDQMGFYYYKLELDEYQVILFRSKDIEEILQMSSAGTALENSYIDLLDAFTLSMNNGKEDFAMYLNKKFVGDHMHPSTPGGPLPRIVSNDIRDADREWTGLIE